MFPVNNRIQIASHVAVDDFELGEKAKNAINDFVEITADARPDDSAIKLHSGMYYHCIDVFSPEIGDIRLQFLTAGIESKSVSIEIILFLFSRDNIPFNFLLVNSTLSLENMRTDSSNRTPRA